MQMPLLIVVVPPWPLTSGTAPWHRMLDGTTPFRTTLVSLARERCSNRRVVVFSSRDQLTLESVESLDQSTRECWLVWPSSLLDVVEQCHEVLTLKDEQSIIIVGPDGWWFTPTDLSALWEEFVKGSGGDVACLQGWPSMAMAISDEHLRAAVGAAQSGVRDTLSWLLSGQANASRGTRVRRIQRTWSGSRASATLPVDIGPASDGVRLGDVERGAADPSEIAEEIHQAVLRSLAFRLGGRCTSNTRAMRIAIVSLGVGFTGVTKHVELLVKGLRLSSCDIRLVVHPLSSWGNGAGPDSEAILCRPSGHFGNDLRDATRIISAMLPDLIHVVGRPGLLPFLVAAEQLGVARVAGCHYADVTGYLESLLMANHVVVPSAFLKRRLIAAGLKDEWVSIIADGVEVAPRIRPRLRSDPGKRILVIGRIEPQKRQHLAVLALKELGDRCGDVSLALYGDWIDIGYVRYLRALVQGTRHVVEMPGHVWDMDGALAEADVVLNCAQEDVLGFALLESMARGVPVVSVVSGGAPEVVPEFRRGEWLSEEEPGDIARALEAALRETERSRLADSLRSHVQRHFSAESAVSQWRELYDEVYARRVSARPTADEVRAQVP